VRSVPGLWLMMGGLLAAQEPMEMGPVPTREMFPLYLITQGYQPVDPTPLGTGRWRVDLERIQSNTFEFSGIFKTQPVQDIEGRVRVTREFVEAHAAEYRDLPLVFFFDEEITRTTLRVRHGIGEATDLWAEWPFQSHSGGRLDHLVEAFHSLGFEQYGRDLVVKDQLTLVVMERGELRFYSDHGIRGKPQDPVIGLTHRLFAHDRGCLSLAFSVKPPITRTYDVYRSGWDHTLALTGRWQPSQAHVFHYGAGYVARPHGSSAHTGFGAFRDGLGAHAGWEWRPSPRFRPFLQLLYQSGYLRPQVYQKLDRPSLQHDLGFHWQLGRRTVFTFRYLNNITHNENTADMGFVLGLSHAL